MKNQDYLDRLPIGECVRSGRVLSAMKKSGLIEGYDSTHKYLDDSYVSRFEYKGHFFESKYLDGCFCPFLFKALPPGIHDRKTGEFVPEKRIYWKSFKANFRRVSSYDQLAANCWNLHYKAEKNGFNGKMFDYVCRKNGILGHFSHRERVPVRNRTMCLFGAIL